MRASRLLQILLLLQNRGRMTSARLAEDLEVSRRTILRDLDAMTEAGLPVIVFPGHGGGIELGFDYRTRLTGLDRQEARAMAILLTLRPAALADLGLSQAGARAQAKIWEAFPDQTRDVMAETRKRFPIAPDGDAADPRRQALARAVEERRIVRLRMRSGAPVVVHPERLSVDPGGWSLWDGLTQSWIGEAEWEDVNISGHRFVPAASPAQ